MRLTLPTSRARAAVAAALLAAAAALPASSARGQTIRGTLRADAAAAPVEGALVALVDSAGDVAGAAVLSRADGGFRLAAPAAGRWRVRVRRIGFLPSEFGPYALAAGQDTTVALTVRWLPVPLAAARVVADARCRGRPASARTVALFDQARLALESERATRAEGLYGVEIERTDRILEDGVTAADPVRRRMRGPTSNPFVTAAPESIAVRGYVADDTAGAVFHAPDAGVLLSDDFLRTHCLEDAKGERGLVAVGVRSMRTLPGVGIQGTVWLDSATLALRRFAFRYENLPRLLRGRRATGELEYRQLPGGRWLVERWTLRIPTPSVPFAGPGGLREGRYDREFVGRVLDVYAIDPTRPETMRV